MGMQRTDEKNEALEEPVTVLLKCVSFHLGFSMAFKLISDYIHPSRFT
jgi:hypothetical protein